MPKKFRAKKSGAPSQVIIDLTRSPAILFSHEVIHQVLIGGKIRSKNQRLHVPKNFGPKKSGAPSQVIIDLTRSPVILLFSHEVLIGGKIRSKNQRLHVPKKLRAKKSGAPSQVIIDLTRSPAILLFSHEVIHQVLMRGKIRSKNQRLHVPKNFGPKKSGAPSQVIIDLTRSPAILLFLHEVIHQVLIGGKIRSKNQRLHVPKKFRAKKVGLRVKS